ncbi:hypothetical protein BH10BAC1_BH10BAC1_02990 [soil metagenome]
MKNHFFKFFAASFAIASSISLFGQTNGTLTFTFTQVAHSPCYTGSKNVLAVWIQSSTGTFIKTKLRNVGSGTKDHLPIWAVNAGGTASNCLAATCNVTDATTGATLTSFGTKTIVWDGKNVAGAVNGVTVPDGVYKVTIQSTWNHGTGSTVTSSFVFTKGTVADSQTPANTADFTGITLNWVPDFTGVGDVAAADPEINVYPNPTTGLFNVDFKKATAIKFVNVLGEVVYEQKIDENSAATVTIDLANLSNGIYFVYVMDEDKSSKRKISLNK